MTREELSKKCIEVGEAQRQAVWLAAHGPLEDRKANNERANRLDIEWRNLYYRCCNFRD